MDLAQSGRSFSMEASCSLTPLPYVHVTLAAHNHCVENAFTDLWLITQFQSLIIIHSTFSWWGAWLATQPAKQLIAPGFEQRKDKMWWGFEGLLPKEWIKL